MKTSYTAKSKETAKKANKDLDKYEIKVNKRTVCSVRDTCVHRRTLMQSPGVCTHV